MSSSDLYILNDRSTTWVAGFKNGWGSGPCMWDHLASKYFPDLNFTEYEKPGWIPHDRKNIMVWDLYIDARVTKEERRALAMTFDGAYVPLDGLKSAGEDCIAAYEMILNHGFWNGVNHWYAFGRKLIEISTRTFDRHARGVALNCTSVNDVWASPTDEQLDSAWSILEDDA